MTHVVETDRELPLRWARAEPDAIYRVIGVVQNLAEDAARRRGVDVLDLTVRELATALLETREAPWPEEGPVPPTRLRVFRLLASLTPNQESRLLTAIGRICVSLPGVEVRRTVLAAASAGVVSWIVQMLIDEGLP